VNEASEFDLDQNEISEVRYTLHNGTYFHISKIKSNHRWEVLKTIQESEISNPVCLRSLQMEFEIGSQLRHSGIVHYYQFNALIKPQLKREFIDGTHWLDFFNRNPSELKNIKRYFQDLLAIIKYMHLNGVYHLDIKSENILITHETYHVKIIDFGHAILENGTHKVGGTKNYQPPNDKGFGFNDVFAMGKLLELTAKIPEAKRIRWIKKTAFLCMKDDRNKNALLLSASLKRTYWKFLAYVVTFILSLILIFTFFSSHNETNTQYIGTKQKQKNSRIQTNSSKGNIVFTDSNLHLKKKATKTDAHNTIDPKLLTFDDSTWIIQNAKTFGPEFKKRFLLGKNSKSTYEIYSVLLDDYQQKWKQMETHWQDSTQKSAAYSVFLKEISLSLIPYQSYLKEN
jgi:serine/threonine protein kinase